MHGKQTHPVGACRKHHHCSRTIPRRELSGRKQRDLRGKPHAKHSRLEVSYRLFRVQKEHRSQPPGLSHGVPRLEL